MAYTDPVTHVAGDLFPSSDWNSYIRDNWRFVHDQGADLTAAATITPVTQFHKVTGNTNITTGFTILAAGARLWLWFTGTPTITHTAAGGATNTVVLGGGVNYTVAANDILEFVSNGTQWLQAGLVKGQTSQTLLLAYNEFTANVTVSGTSEGTANTVVTASAFTADGVSPVLISFWCPQFTDTTNGVVVAHAWLFQDGSSIGSMHKMLVGNAASTSQYGVAAFRRLTPASGSRTYSVRMSDNGGTGSANAGAGGAGNLVPGFIRITKDA